MATYKPNIYAYEIDYFDDREIPCYAEGAVRACTMAEAAETLYEFFNGAIQKMELKYMDPQDENTDVYVKEHGEWSI